MSPSANAVVDILKLGLPGLVFLFAFLAYRLLRQEQQREGQPRPELLAEIRRFQYVCLIAAVLTIVASLLHRPEPDQDCLLFNRSIVVSTSLALGNESRGTVRLLSTNPAPTSLAPICANLEFSSPSSQLCYEQGKPEPTTIGKANYQVVVTGVTRNSAVLSICRAH